MCDEGIHPGLIADPSMTRRTFATLSAAVVGAAPLSAAAEVAVSETDVLIKTPDGTADAVIVRPVREGPAGDGPWPGVLMWPDILSLRPVFRAMGRRLAAEGYVVLVPNLYYRARKAPVIEGPFSFANPEDRAKVAPLRAALTPEAIDRDAAAFLAFLDGDDAVDKARKLGVQGYCMGGPFAFRAAALAPARVGAVASFHGAGLVTPEPSSPHRLIAATAARFLVEIAENDDQQDPGAKEILKTAFAAAGRAAQVEVFAGANHGWTVPGSQVYNEAAAETAWTNLIALYRQTL